MQIAICVCLNLNVKKISTLIGQVKINKGSGLIKLTNKEKRVNDGAWHTVGDILLVSFPAFSWDQIRKDQEYSINYSCNVYRCRYKWIREE